MRKRLVKECLFALGVVAVATLTCFAADSFLEPINLVMIYLLGTLLVAARGHRLPAAASSTLSVLAFDFFFVPPRFTFTVENAQYLMTFVAMIVTAVLVSHLAMRFRAEAEVAREGERQQALMGRMTQELASAGTEEILRVAATHIARTLNADVGAYRVNGDGRVEPDSFSTPPMENERAAAQWAHDHLAPSGAFSGDLPLNAAVFVPVLGSGGCVAVLAARPLANDRALGPEQRLLLDSLARQVGLAMEVRRLERKSRQAEIETETERLRSALLSSVSHDLQTPLAAIVGSASALLEKDEIKRTPAIAELAENIQEEGERLSRLVKNLLQTTRLQSGTVIVRKERYPLEEVVGTALERLARLLQNRSVTVRIPTDLPPVPIDAVLFEQALINLLENAARHTPAGSPIHVAAKRMADAFEVSIADEGPGLDASDLERVFEKFYHHSSSSGTGLGLTICRAIVDAHGGRVWVENRPEGGAVFRMVLPMEAADVP